MLATIGTRNKALIRILHSEDKINELTLDAYNIDDNNFFKLRDSAYVLNITNLNFNVEWNNDKRIIEIKTNIPYIDTGGEI